MGSRKALAEIGRVRSQVSGASRLLAKRETAVTYYCERVQEEQAKRDQARQEWDRIQTRLALLQERVQWTDERDEPIPDGRFKVEGIDNALALLDEQSRDAGGSSGD